MESCEFLIMKQRVKDKLDLFIAVALITISNILPVMDAGPFVS